MAPGTYRGIPVPEELRGGRERWAEPDAYHWRSNGVDAVLGPPPWSGRRLYFENLDCGGNTAIGEVYPDNPRVEMLDPACANLVSSLASGRPPWMHLPVIDIDMPCELVPAEGDGCSDLYVFATISDMLARFDPRLVELNAPCKLVPSTTEGHFHLYIDRVYPWYEYVLLLSGLVAQGVVEEGYFKAAERRAATFVRMPDVKKAPPVAGPDTDYSVPALRNQALGRGPGGSWEG